jgi:hypothetical protein
MALRCIRGALRRRIGFRFGFGQASLGNIKSKRLLGDGTE